MVIEGNIFQIWEALGHKTPFALRRDNWSNEYYVVVERIECPNMPYGKAFGYPTINGLYSTHYCSYKQWRENKEIPNAGSYQWTFVEHADLESYKAGIKATKLTVSSAFTLNSFIRFGKHAGETVDQIFRENPHYIQWAIQNSEPFFLNPETFSYLNNINPKFKFSLEAEEINKRKIAKKQGRILLP